MKASPEVKRHTMSPMDNLMVGVYNDGVDGLLRGMTGGELVIHHQRSKAVDEIGLELTKLLSDEGYLTVDGIRTVIENWHQKEV